MHKNVVFINVNAVTHYTCMNFETEFTFISMLLVIFIFHS